nr:FecR domain-containing protein [Halomonas sp.]
MKRSSTASGEPDDSHRFDEDMLDTALSWHLRVKDDSATPQDRLDFQRWISACDSHQAAYQEALQLWDDIEAPAQLFGQYHSAQQSRPTQAAPRYRLGWAVAAVLMLTMLLSFELWRDPARLDRWMADIATSSGKAQQVELEDGSSLFLDGNSALDIALGESQRELTLRRGRLWIDAYRDSQRPMRIVAGDISVTVLGTHFAVSRFHSRVTITVGEGRVAVSDAYQNQAVLTSGQQLIVDNGKLGETQQIDTQLALAWKEGRIIFDRAGIDDVVEQLERLLPGRVIFNDQEFADLSFSGSFSTDHPDIILETLTSLSTIEAHHLPGNMIWLRSTSAG